MESNTPLRLVEIDMPKYLSAGQVLVRIIYSGACASQLHEIEARKGEDRYLPHLLGHEAVGEVIECGPGVQTKSPGDIVIAHWRKGDGIEAGPSVFNSSIGAINGGSVTTFSEYSLISENRLTVLPREISFENAPLLGCSLTTGYGAVVKEANVRPGESAVIIGFGGVGISILKALKLVSAFPIVVVDVVEEKLTLARKLGADFVIHSTTKIDSISNQLFEIIPEGADVVFEVTGNQRAIEDAYLISNNSGRTILIGVPEHNKPANIKTLPLHLGKKLIGSHGGSINPSLDIPRIAKIIRANKLSLEDFPKTYFALGKINDALNELRAGALGRILIKM